MCIKWWQRKLHLWDWHHVHYYGTLERKAIFLPIYWSNFSFFPQKALSTSSFCITYRCHRPTKPYIRFHLLLLLPSLRILEPLSCKAWNEIFSSEKILYIRKADMWKDKVPEPAFRSCFFFRHLYFMWRTNEKNFPHCFWIIIAFFL